MASEAEHALPATWPFLRDLFNEVERTGQAFSNPDFDMMVHKELEGVLEECHYSGVWIPIRDRSGSIAGFYNSIYEITRFKIMERRSRLLGRIAALPDFHKRTAWQHILEALEPFEKDIPLLALYSAVIEERPQSEVYVLKLEGTLGTDASHPATPSTLHLHDEDDGFLSKLRAAKASGEPVFIDVDQANPPAYLHGIKWRGFGDVPHVILVAPLFVTGILGGFIIAGLNPRRPFNEDHKQFALDLNRVAIGAVAGSISFEQAMARESRLTQQVTERERFIRKLAEIATVGIYSLTTEGVISWANPMFYELTGVSSRDEDNHGLFQADSVIEEDRPLAVNAMGDAIKHHKSTVLELRQKLKWTPPGVDTPEPRQILVSIVPNVINGVVENIIGCITDIKAIKWSEKLQTQAAEAALEAKKRQERFIDTTSHEMRNPLSALMQSADGIGSLVERARGSREQDAELMEILGDISENSSTIMFCAAHQKRIVDDVLTVSRLDSSMLTITPVLADVAVVVKQCMQMFEAEFSAFEFNASYMLESTYNDLKVSWVHCDPSRLTQVIINLITNAIKFTKTSAKREIQVKLGASTDLPAITGLQWFPSAQRQSSPEPETCTKQEVYITVQVTDTGKGISADEMSLLFKRFAQANPKTHIQYGGSGLGLFISRELTELQRGVMGAMSEPGKGSTFGFYIKARRATMLEMAGKQTSFQSPSGGPRRPPATPNTRAASTTLASGVAPKRILLVEDNILNQKVLSKQLRRLGCIVHIANHGLEALEFLRTTRFWRDNAASDGGEDLTVVLMDWEMPVMDGLSATRKMRQWEAEGVLTRHLKVIATTANAREEQVQMALQAGVVSCFVFFPCPLPAFSLSMTDPTLVL